MAADVLDHEWAHALAWGRGVTEHGPTFGVLWARAYRASMTETAAERRRGGEAA